MGDRKKKSKSKKPKASAQASAKSKNSININIDMSRGKQPASNVKRYTRGVGPMGYVGLRGIPYSTSSTTVINNTMPSDTINAHFTREMMMRSIMDEAKSLKAEQPHMSKMVDTAASYLSNSLPKATSSISSSPSYAQSSSSSGSGGDPYLPMAPSVDMASIKSEPISDVTMNSVSLESVQPSEHVDTAMVSAFKVPLPGSSISSNSVKSEPSLPPARSGPSRPPGRRGSESTVEEPNWYQNYVDKLEKYQTNLAVLKTKSGPSSRQDEEKYKAKLKSLATKVAKETGDDDLLMLSEQPKPKKNYYLKLGSEIGKSLSRSVKKEN
jgi:hypothetical protein